MVVLEREERRRGDGIFAGRRAIKRNFTYVAVSKESGGALHH
jgi:hypothetical protein